MAKAVNVDVLLKYWVRIGAWASSIIQKMLFISFNCFMQIGLTGLIFVPLHQVKKLEHFMTAGKFDLKMASVRQRD